VIARARRFAAVTALAATALLSAAGSVHAQARSDESLPQLTQPVNDFAHIIDPQSTSQLEMLIRALQAASGDVVVVATVPTIEPFATMDDYKVKLFENHGRGIGAKGKDNGLLIVVAPKERLVGIEVGYDLEQWITDGFAGQTIREVIAPAFREGRYGPGLVAATARLVGRIAQARNVTLQGVPVPREQPEPSGTPLSVFVPILVFLAILIVSRIGGGPGAGMMLWGAGRGWSGWSSGVGPFGGGWGGGYRGGGGFGGGFGGFGGGSSGGGGASGGW
jgi:uncharacterized protein